MLTNKQSKSQTDSAENNTTLAMLRCAGGNMALKEGSQLQ